MVILVFLVPLLGCAGCGLLAAGASPSFDWRLELDRSQIVTISVGPALNDRCYKPPYACAPFEWWRRTLGVTHRTAKHYRTLLIVPLPDWRAGG